MNVAEHQIKSAIKDFERIQRKMAKQHWKKQPGGCHWVSAMDGFASKNYRRCTICGATADYARKRDD